MLVTMPYNQVSYPRLRSLFELLRCANLGMLATSTRSLLENLDRIPNQDGRTKISIVCFDVSLYFFSMPVSIVFKELEHSIHSRHPGRGHGTHNAGCF